MDEIKAVWGRIKGRIVRGLGGVGDDNTWDNDDEHDDGSYDVSDGDVDDVRDDRDKVEWKLWANGEWFDVDVDVEVIKEFVLEWRDNK